jgi:hypothetical protein
VLSQLPDFLRFSVDCAEQRLLRMGVLTRPLRELGPLAKGMAVAEAWGSSLLAAPFRLLPRRRLTETYLRDPAVTRRAAAAEEKTIRMVR